MRRYIAVLIILLGCCGCALTPDEIRPVPHSEARAVVFDIDGTLTPNVTSVFSVRPEAARSVQLYADKGYAIIYLSARIKLLQSRIPSWLEKNGFPAGPIHVPETSDDRNDHAAFKASVLKEYIAEGWILSYAYGDSSSDFEAYTTAGIPQEHIFALQRKGDSICQPGRWNCCLESWEEHLEYIADLHALDAQGQGPE